MPARSAVYALDDATRAALNQRIVSAGFGGYAAHAAWLAELGHPTITVRVLQRYGSRLRREREENAARLRETTAAAVARIQASSAMAKEMQRLHADDPLAVPKQAAIMTMARAYELAAQEGIDAKTLQGLARTVNESLRTIAAVRSEREAEDRLAAAGAAVFSRARRSGLSEEVAAALQQEVVQGGVRDKPEPGMSEEVLARIDRHLMPDPAREDRRDGGS